MKTGMESSPLHLLFLLGYCLALIEGELRCHCNESGCVATGYMCKSRAGQCYTALEVRGEDTHLTHGCLDSLPEHHRALCQKLADPASSTAIHADGDVAVAGYERASPGKPTHSERSQHPVSASTPRSPREPDRRSSRNSDSSGGSSSSSNLSAGMHHHHQQELLQQQPQQQRQGQVQDPSAPTLLCCTEHMCNYREDTDITMNLMPKLNSTYQRGGASKIDEGSVYARDHHSARRRDDDADRDLWFKAAVIAVPIAGGFILVLLVLLAVRMLRSDSTRHRRLIQIRRERSLTKAQMYISEHFMGDMSSTSGMKSKLQHCSLFSEKPHSHRGSYSVYSEKMPPSSGSSARGGSGGGSVVAGGSTENSHACSSSGNVIFKNSSNSSSSGGHNNRGGFSSDICCTDERPCCGGLCSVQRETQIRHCETCNNKRRSMSSYNTNCRCSKTCHSNPPDCGSSPKSTSDSKTSISSSSSSIEGLSASRQPKSSHVQQTHYSSSTDLPINLEDGVVYRDKSEISAHHNAPPINCDHHNVRTAHSQTPQHPHAQQYRTVVAHWDKTNHRAPTAVV